MQPMEAWDEGESWGSSGDRRSGQQADQRGARRDDWGYAEPSAEWGEQPSGRRQRGRAAERRRDGWDDDPAYSSGAHAGYTDERHASRYDQQPGGYPDGYSDGYGEYNEDDEYSDTPSDRKRGGGWLGFMRRDKR